MYPMWHRVLPITTHTRWVSGVDTEALYVVQGVVRTISEHVSYNKSVQVTDGVRPGVWGIY